MASARPVMRGFLASQLKKHAIVCTVVATIATAATAFIYKDGRMKRYEDFYKYVVKLDCNVCALVI